MVPRFFNLTARRFPVSKCPFPATVRRTLPVPVIRNRRRAERILFIFIFAISLFLFSAGGGFLFPRCFFSLVFGFCLQSRFNGKDHRHKPPFKERRLLHVRDRG